SMWNDIAEFGEDAVHWYRRDVWKTQPRYLELWVEKDALSGFFADELEPYGVTFNVGRGYDSWSSIKDVADRLACYVDRDPLIFYFRDFDHSGKNWVIRQENCLRWFGLKFETEKVPLPRAHIDRYNLPPNSTKSTDTRAAAHIARHGDIAVELDALPVEVLRE